HKPKSGAALLLRGGGEADPVRTRRLRVRADLAPLAPRGAAHRDLPAGEGPERLVLDRGRSAAPAGRAGSSARSKRETGRGKRKAVGAGRSVAPGRCSPGRSARFSKGDLDGSAASGDLLGHLAELLINLAERKSQKLKTVNSNEEA